MTYFKYENLCLFIMVFIGRLRAQGFGLWETNYLGSLSNILEKIIDLNIISDLD